MTLSRQVVPAGETQHISLDSGRNYWVQVVKGKLAINDQLMKASDALALTEESSLTLQAEEDAEVLIFDLPPV